MSTNYPSALDSYTTKIDLVTDVMAADINNPQDAIIAIETELGLDPRGSYTDVSARITDYAARIANLEIGWVALPNGTRVSDTSFTLPGDYSGVLKNFAKWKGFLSSQKYGYVLSSSYSSGTGLTTVNLVPNSDYSLSVGGTITGMFVSFGNPPDFTVWFSWPASSLTGVILGNGSIAAKFSISDKKLFFDFILTFGTTTTIAAYGEFSFNLPMTVSPTEVSTVTGDFRDTGSGNHLVVAVLGVSRCYLYRAVPTSISVASGLIDANSPFSWANGDQIGATGWARLT
jgi:hypothetical protein